MLCSDRRNSDGPHRPGCLLLPPQNGRRRTPSPMGLRALRGQATTRRRMWGTGAAPFPDCPPVVWQPGNLHYRPFKKPLIGDVDICLASSLYFPPQTGLCISTEDAQRKEDLGGISMPGRKPTCWTCRGSQVVRPIDSAAITSPSITALPSARSPSLNLGRDGLGAWRP